MSASVVRNQKCWRAIVGTRTSGRWHLQHTYFTGLETGIRYGKLCEVSKLVGVLSTISVPPTKPIVGPNVFRGDSGVAALQLLQFPPALESFVPDLVEAKTIRG